jgi:hypothetical protein
MSTSRPSRSKTGPVVKPAPSAYSQLIHAEESEILSWAVKTAISDLGTKIGHWDALMMRRDLRERHTIFLMLLKRLIDQLKRTGES